MTPEQKAFLKKVAETDPTVAENLRYFDAVQSSGGICACDGAYDDGCYTCSPDKITQDLRKGFEVA